MADEKKDKPESEKEADGGETGKKKTTEKTPEELQQIADDQRKRAEKAEADLKAERAKHAKPDEKPEEDKNKINAQVTDPVEVAKLANALTGLSDDAVAQLIIVAKAKNISLAEAKKDSLFSAWFDQTQEVAKKEKAKRGASRGSSQEDEDKTPEGMVPDIHKTLEEQRQAHQTAVRKFMSK